MVNVTPPDRRVSGTSQHRSASQTSRIVLELTPFLSRNNRPNPQGKEIRCISMLRRLRNAGVKLPDRPETKDDVRVHPVAAAIAARLFHDCNNGEDIIIQSSVKASSILRTAVKATQEGHQLAIVYTDALAYTDVPEEEAYALELALVNLQRRVLKTLPHADSFSVCVAPSVSYRTLRYHGDALVAFESDSAAAPLHEQFSGTWVELFHRVWVGEPLPTFSEHYEGYRLPIQVSGSWG